MKGSFMRKATAWEANHMVKSKNSVMSGPLVHNLEHHNDANKQQYKRLEKCRQESSNHTDIGQGFWYLIEEEDNHLEHGDDEVHRDLNNAGNAFKEFKHT